MRLLLVMPSGSPHGGAEEALLQFVSYRTGHEEPVTVALLEPGPLEAMLRARGARVEGMDAGKIRDVRRVASTTGRLTVLAREARAEMVVSWMTKAHIYGGAAGKRANIPAAYFQMGLPDDGLLDRMSRLVKARGGICCSEFAARMQRTRVSHPVLAVPLAADFARFDAVAAVAPAAMRQKLGLEPTGVLVGMVGRLQSWKGMHVFLRAFALVAQSRPEVQGVIVGGPHKGEPGYENELKRLRRELGLDDRVAMVGVQSNVPEWMQAMDVVVHASREEPFGIVVVEAMSLGKPVVATVPGGPEEIVEDCVSGLLVPWNRPQALADAICKLMLDHELREQIGKAAQERAKTFTVERFGARLDAALANLLAAA